MYRILYLLAFLLFTNSSIAAPPKLNGKRRPPPRKILVMLSTETNRYKALVGDGRLDDAQGVLKDRDAIQRVTRADFKKHFDFCPVYFFYDTDLDKVKSGAYDGNIFDADSTVAPTNTVSDTNFLIVFYGLPTWQTGRSAMEVTSQSTVGGKPNGRGLILNNYEMKQVGYVYWLGIPGTRVYERLNGYQSVKFDMEYMPLAKELNEKLYRYAGMQAPKKEKQKKRAKKTESEEH